MANCELLNTKIRKYLRKKNKQYLFQIRLYVFYHFVYAQNQ